MYTVNLCKVQVLYSGYGTSSDQSDFKILYYNLCVSNKSYTCTVLEVSM